jgi:predicted metal-dependent hydrolase
MLNTQLVRFDERYWDYVILHELTHITQPHHQAAFWSLFTEYLPEAKALAKETRQLNLWP